MLGIIKHIYRHSFLRRWIEKRRRERELDQWDEQGRPLPPPHLFKVRLVKEYATRFGLKLFVETGTYRGDMVEAVRRHFDHIISIELDDTLFKQAQDRFSRAANVVILQGDSGKQLPEALNQVRDAACLFWLDGHFSAGVTAKADRNTPIVQELETICARNRVDDVILIDDARLFVGLDDYPSISEIRNLISTNMPAWIVENRDDVIRIYKPLSQ